MQVTKSKAHHRNTDKTKRMDGLKPARVLSLRGVCLKTRASTAFPRWHLVDAASVLDPETSYLNLRTA